MMDILMFAGFVVIASTFAIGMWALGRWLRSKGYGPQLDKLDRQFTALQLRVSPLALSASYRMFSGAQALNRLPLLGSKNNAALNQQSRTGSPEAREARQSLIAGQPLTTPPKCGVLFACRAPSVYYTPCKALCCVLSNFRG